MKSASRSRRLFQGSLFYFGLIAMTVLFALSYMPVIYIEWFHATLQTGELIVITLRNILSWMIALALVGFLAFCMIRQRPRIVRKYPVWLYRSALFYPAIVVLVFMTFEWHTPQTSYDLARYYAQGIVEEKQATVSSTGQTCELVDTYESCTLWVTLSDGSRYGVKSPLADVFKQRSDVEAVRVLPSSGRLIGIRTSDGWS